ncbi:MAG: flagellar export chaperone FliS [Terriglobales bacterium]
MTRNQTELTYLRAAVQSASAVGLVILLYDLLISDLRGAIAAIERRDIEARSKEIKHAFLVLQQMEDSLDLESGGEAAANLSRFYASLRCSILEAHAKISPEILNHQIQLLFQVRGAWTQVDKQSATAPDAAISPAAPESGTLEPEESCSNLAMSWSA